jgi:DNA-binding response OmpR family regulator
MKVLIAEDDPISLLMLQKAMADWGYEVTAVRSGVSAWRILQEPDAPKLAILDWMLPDMDGLEICQRVRAQPTSEPPYLVLLTSRDGKKDIVTGLQAGASDYITKPFDREELRARIKVGHGMVELQRALATRVQELEVALAQVKQLQGLLPICSYCKKVRDDQNYWQQVEHYVAARSEARFSHGICPECWQKEILPQMERQLKRG